MKEQQDQENNCIGVYHSYIYEKIKEKKPPSFDNIVKRSFLERVFWGHQIPKKDITKFLCEMEEFGLIKKVGINQFELLK